MLRPSLVRAARAHKPMIKFPDRRAPKPEHKPQPHPDAPEDIANNFEQFRQVLESGPHYDPSKLKPFSLDSGKSASGQTGSRDAVTTVFDLPRRFWDTPALRMSPAEMDAIQSGGASMMD
ncbi:hypothetical protein MGL_2329 [Malassezia globosa CBS 7966]|uniref:Ribosomal protein S36, mitochondrial n=1 Tax=Malassezia globosa (strain ATCC MYA-4612 / CBS 7966) TaxID=425265 RepID=A8Q377_MALGO|nr:uncharacterized protein MGL_2329 [Malassezia globosa CBS 7966]EDP43319.1 hypothetical protein MGL_2329 [Malassezia globosa CBS 7966]